MTTLLHGPRRAGSVRVITILTVLATVAAIALLPAATLARGDTPQHVTLIGDSVPEALVWGPAQAILSQGIDLDLEATACRRTEEDSCFGDGGARPPTLIQLVQSLGSAVGQTVVVMIGYNDYEDQYQKDIGDALTVMAQAGVKHVIWLNLREARVPYVSMNAAIGYWASIHPELTVLDWNAYSRSHLDWFQSDGLHLTQDGSIALATFIHSSLSDLGVAAPPPPPAPTTTTGTTTTGPTVLGLRIVSARLPAATRGTPYTSALAAAGGRPPYRWKAVSKLPQGFGLAHDGLVTGIPRTAPGIFGIVFRVTDAHGGKAVRRILVSVHG